MKTLIIWLGATHLLFSGLLFGQETAYQTVKTSAGLSIDLPVGGEWLKGANEDGNIFSYRIKDPYGGGHTIDFHFRVDRRSVDKSVKHVGAELEKWQDKMLLIQLSSLDGFKYPGYCYMSYLPIPKEGGGNSCFRYSLMKLDEDRTIVLQVVSDDDNLNAYLPMLFHVEQSIEETK